MPGLVLFLVKLEGWIIIMSLQQPLEKELQIKLNRKEKELTALLEISQVANQKNSLEENLHNIIDIALDLIKEKRLTIRIYDEQTNQLILQAHRGMPKGYTEKFSILSPCEEAYTLLQKGHPIIVPNISLLGGAELHDFAVRHGLISFLGIPLITKGRVIGIINIYSDQLDYYRKEDETLYKTLANQIAITIENSRLYNNLKQSYLETIRALVVAVEAKDPYTKGHAERVAQYALAIGRELGLEKKFLKNLEIAAILHDIGKIGVSESILTKPSHLTEEEFTLLKKHPVQGQQILQPIKFEPEIMDGVYYHHERLDGKGYPEGLRKEEIPLTARILAVADAFDAMTSDRPYRGRLPTDYALCELIKCSGTQFDPEIVKAFLNFWKNCQQC